MKAILTRCVVVDEPKAGGAVFYGTVENDRDKLNIRLPYSWPDIETDKRKFLEAIRETAAEELGVATFNIDLQDSLLLEKLEFYWKQLTELIFLLHEYTAEKKRLLYCLPKDGKN